jgi:hypothetical protein
MWTFPQEPQIKLCLNGFPRIPVPAMQNPDKIIIRHKCAQILLKINCSWRKIVMYLVKNLNDLCKSPTVVRIVKTVKFHWYEHVTT